MRFLNIFILCSMLLVQQLKAQTQLLTIYRTDGTMTKFPFDSKPVITFGDNYLILKTNTTEVSYPINNIRKYTLNEIKQDLNSKEIIINDDELLFYENLSDIDNCNIKYIRTFNDTHWQPLYVPFELTSFQLQEDFEVAVINNFHQYDDDKDGVFDRTELEIRQIKDEETLLPNYPYLIKAKEIGVKTICQENATLYSTEICSIDCSSVEIKYSFTGVYSKIENLRALGYYFLDGGVLNRPQSSSNYLSPFRWYMQMTPRGSQLKDDPIIVNSAQIRIREIQDDITENKHIKVNDIAIPTRTYSVNGQKVITPHKSGVYIMHMSDGSIKKVFVK